MSTITTIVANAHGRGERFLFEEVIGRASAFVLSAR
jgi:hypothetical protein